jgi:membrane protease YdiL (CAAX protease family)
MTMERTSLLLPFAGVLIAVAITATMDASGLTLYSALPLLPLLAFYWYLQRLSRRQVGFVFGNWGDYGLAALYPLVVVGAAVIVAVLAGQTHIENTNWEKAGLNFAIMALSTMLVAILTEEGFFRGWFWASLERAGIIGLKLIVWTSIAFAVWHISEVTLAKGFTLPAAQVPIFIANAAVMGAIWGLLRLISGSVIVASVSHGLWNGGAYVLFGVGARVGSLGITDHATFGVEVGIVGLILNLVFAIALWRWWSTKRLSQSSEARQ